MRRLWAPVTAALLCVATAGLVWVDAALAPASHRSTTSRVTAPPSPVLPMISLPPLASPAPARAEAAAGVNQAARAVLPSAQVGFEVFDRAAGTVLASQDADRQVAAMSLVKLLIALDVLAGDNAAVTQQELRQMLATSDDQIASELWTDGGGPAIVTRMVSLLGLTGTRPPDDPGEWGDTLITPQDMVTLYRYITDHLPDADQDLLLRALAETPETAADGFDQHFGIPDGMPNTSWAAKQGWGTSGSQAVMNSAGLVGSEWRYVVVLLGSAPASSYTQLRTAVTAGAGALADLVSAAGP